MKNQNIKEKIMNVLEHKFKINHLSDIVNKILYVSNILKFELISKIEAIK